MEGSSQNTVELGVHEYVVVPQPHALILRKFPKALQQMQQMVPDADVGSTQNIVEVLGDRIHGVLRIFIPDLMSYAEFQGFESKEKLELDEFNEEYAQTHAPTIPEIFHAFDVAIAVNGGKRLMSMLGNALGPEISRALRSYVVAMMRARLSEMSQNSLQVSGESGQTTSGMKSPTPEQQASED